MPGLSAIATLHSHSRIPDELLFDMLKWTGPLYAQKSDKIQMVSPALAMGTFQPGILHHDPENQLQLLFCGNLHGKSTIHSLIKRYIENGEASFSELDGRFAFILLDEKKRQLFAVRDRLGIMPLYWHINRTRAYFSTSIKAILSTGAISPTPDLAGIASSLGLGFISQDVTSIQEINRLLPGYYLKLSLQGGFSIQPYWSFSSHFAKSYSTHFDSSHDIYCELERHLKVAIQKPDVTKPATLSQTVGSQMIVDSLRTPPSQINTVVTPEDFLNNLIPMVWAMEMPNAEMRAIETMMAVRTCQQQSLTPYFDTGFRFEFYDYTKDALELFQTHYQVHRYEEQTLWSKLGFYLAPGRALSSLRRRQEATPQSAFLEKALLFAPAEFEDAAPELSRYFNITLFIHQFYNLPRISKLDASLFYLTMKSVVTDGVSEARLRISDSFGIESQSPFLDYQLLEFFASISPEVWASPDLISAFPKYWQESHTLRPQTTPLDIKSLLLSEKVLPWFASLPKGMLVETGLVMPSWIKKALRSPKEHIHALYAMLVLEVWMRLFVDQPLRESNKDLKLEDILVQSQS